jgi:hypothetical protein
MISSPIKKLPLVYIRRNGNSVDCFHSGTVVLPALGVKFNYGWNEQLLESPATSKPAGVFEVVLASRADAELCKT